MTNILDRVALDRSEFCPNTIQEFFALQLARKLNDASSVRSYLALVDCYPEELLLNVYRHTLGKGRGEGMADRFRIELRRRTREEGYDQ